MALSRVILIVLILNTLVLLGSTGANYFLLSSVLQGSSPLPFSSFARPQATTEYQFFPIEKVIVNLRDKDREHYFVLDLVLQSELSADRRKIEQIDPIVRNAVIAYLSTLSFQELRPMPISEMQSRLESVLLDDLRNRNLGGLFSHLLVSKMMVQ
jgi:flagellar protein FliL